MIWIIVCLLLLFVAGLLLGWGLCIASKRGEAAMMEAIATCRLEEYYKETFGEETKIKSERYDRLCDKDPVPCCGNCRHWNRWNEDRGYCPELNVFTADTEGSNCKSFETQITKTK